MIHAQYPTLDTPSSRRAFFVHNLICVLAIITSILGLLRDFHLLIKLVALWNILYFAYRTLNDLPRLIGATRSGRYASIAHANHRRLLYFTPTRGYRTLHRNDVVALRERGAILVRADKTELDLGAVLPDEEILQPFVQQLLALWWPTLNRDAVHNHIAPKPPFWPILVWFVFFMSSLQVAHSLLETAGILPFLIAVALSIGALHFVGLYSNRYCKSHPDYAVAVNTEARKA
jgi:hypothetical protein